MNDAENIGRDVVLNAFLYCFSRLAESFLLLVPALLGSRRLKEVEKTFLTGDGRILGHDEHVPELRGL
jgi:hypothetical protein